MTEFANNDELLSVGQLNNIAKNLLEGHLANVRVVAEISNLSIPSSGHMYFTLKDDTGSVRCAFFKGKQLGLNFKPKDGDQCIVNAQVSLYVPRGDYQLIIHSIEPYGAGNLMAAFEKLKAKLHKEGLFDLEHKLEIPSRPKHIGIITSASTAAFQDILTCLSRRSPFAKATLIPATVQGDKSPRELIQALRNVEKYNSKSSDPIDVLIIARGGGSIEDLWSFNNEDLAFAIYNCTIPIVSGIGHEIDFTIADFVADLRAPTPTAAAEIVSQGMFKITEELEIIKYSLERGIQLKIKNTKNILNQLSIKIKSPKELIKSWSQTIDLAEIKLSNNMKNILKDYKNSLSNLKQAIFSQSPKLSIIGLRSDIREYSSLLKKSIKSNIKLSESQIILLKGKLETLNPLAILDRGFSVTFDASGKILRDAKDIKPQDLIRTRLAQGEIISKINDTQ
ncbi:MAG: exodeoxyribonuclease VII large subunit [Gammaproteobacteria bacterium]